MARTAAGKGKEKGKVMKNSLDTRKTTPAPPSTISSTSVAVTEPVPIVHELALVQEQVDETEKNNPLLSAENVMMEEHAGHILEQMTEFIKVATGENHPLPFGMSDPLDQILKGFNENGGKNGEIEDTISSGGSGREWGGGGVGWSDSDDERRVLHSDRQGPETSCRHTVIESRGAALLPVQHALFEESHRIDWHSSLDEDESVLSLLGWIQMAGCALGEFGLRKFLHCGKRGALFTNVNYHPKRNPQQPAFQWITVDDFQQARDNTIHESVASYDPAVQVLVFIILPSITDNSIAMWVRKVDVPNGAQLLLQNEIKAAMHELRGQTTEPYDFAKAESTKKFEEDLPNIPLEISPSQQTLQAPWDVTGPPQSSDVPIDGVLHYKNNPYQNLCDLIHREIAASPHRRDINRIQEALQEASESLASLNNIILALSRSHQCRAKLMEICSALKIQDSPPVRQALQIDEKDIFVLLQQILSSMSSHKKAVLELQGKDAESFMDLLQRTLDRYQSDPGFWRSARRLLVKLSEVSGIIPASLTVQGVTLLEKEAVFGGGFADIYRASHNNKEVALKRMRIFQRGQERHEIHRTFCKEALIWQSLRHPHVLPFLGVDSDTFSPYLCMVSPWMQHGTIVRHLSENTSADVNKLLKEVAQGLDYLHSQKVVHGDLRGGNILINDEWQACLADFGLTVVSEATLATQTSNGHGSVRWMAPELHDPESFGLKRFLRTFASDIYAFGCVCFEVYTSRAPFADTNNDSAVMLQVLRGMRPRRPLPDTSRRMSDDVWGLIEQCWRQMPSERPDIHKIVEITGEWK